MSKIELTEENMVKGPTMRNNFTFSDALAVALLIWAMLAAMGAGL